MAYIELNRLRLLHQSMNVHRIDRYRFPFYRNHKEFDVFFFADMMPYELMFGLVRGQWSFSVKVLEGYRVNAWLGDDYVGLCKALDLKHDPKNPFRPADFFKDLNHVVPSEASRNNEVEPEEVARYCRSSVEEPDKIYFLGWREHLDPEVRDVTERNLEKTRRLLGEDAYLRCRKYHISTAWTDDPKKASNRWRYLSKSVTDGRDIGDVEAERAFKNAVTMGLSDLREGREISLNDAKMRLGLC